MDLLYANVDTIYVYDTILVYSFKTGHPVPRFNLSYFKKPPCTIHYGKSCP